MAKETCALCGNMVGAMYRVRLGDGNIICADCRQLTKLPLTTKFNELSIDDIRQHMATNAKSIAAQDKKAYKEQTALDKFGLDFERYSVDDLHARNAFAARELSASLAGSKLYSFGSLLSGNPSQTFTMEMERAQVHQNNILIRQNEEIIRLLRQLVDGK